jgi:hypothetical protein
VFVLSSTNNLAAGLPTFVYLKRAGKHQFWLAASGRGSSLH